MMMIIVPLIFLIFSPSISAGELVQKPLCDRDLQNDYCRFGGDMHTACRFCGLGLQCPGTNPSGRGLKGRVDIQEEIVKRHNEYRATVRKEQKGAKCIPDIR